MRSFVPDLPDVSVDATASEGARASAPRVSEEAWTRVGACLGRYQLLRPLGAGGLGTVFAALDPELDRLVAIKILHRQHAVTTAEGRALAQISHPHVVRVLHHGQEGETSFLVMEKLQGCTLLEWAKHERPSKTALMSALHDVARGVAAIHRAGWLHRDIKPSNIMVANGRSTVVDLGLAVPQMRSSRECSGGTPGYSSPESAYSAQATTASDVYSYGATAKRCFEWANRKPPRWFLRIIDRALSADPQNRPRDMAEVAQAFAARGRSMQLRGRLAAATLVVSFLAGYAWMHRPPAVCADPLGPDVRALDVDDATVQDELVEQRNVLAQLYAEVCKKLPPNIAQADTSLIAQWDCLEQERLSLVEGFAVAEESWQKRDVLRQMAPQARCGDPRSALRSAPPPPADVFDEVSAIRRVLREERRFANMTSAELQAFMNNLIERARLTGFEPLVAEVMLDAFERSRDPQASIQLARDALATAIRADHGEVVAYAATAMVRACHDWGLPDSTCDLWQTIADNSARTPRETTIAAINRVGDLVAREDIEGALAALADIDIDDVARLDSLTSFNFMIVAGNTYANAERYKDAREAWLKAADIEYPRRRRRGALTIATVLRNVAETYLVAGAGDAEGALGILDNAEKMVAQYPPDGESRYILAILTLSRSWALLELGQLERAEDDANRAAAFLAEHVTTRETQQLLGHAYSVAATVAAYRFDDAAYREYVEAILRTEPASLVQADRLAGLAIAWRQHVVALELAREALDTLSHIDAASEYTDGIQARATWVKGVHELQKDHLRESEKTLHAINDHHLPDTLARSLFARDRAELAYRQGEHAEAERWVQTVSEHVEEMKSEQDRALAMRELQQMLRAYAPKAADVPP